MTKSMKSLMVTAAVSGLLGGSATAFAAPAPAADNHSNLTAAGQASSFAGYADTDKHACKGKNDCKGKGGCKASDNGCKGKNSCKGKGGCATDGSKPPKV